MQSSREHYIDFKEKKTQELSHANTTWVQWRIQLRGLRRCQLCRNKITGL